MGGVMQGSYVLHKMVQSNYKNEYRNFKIRN